MTSVLVIQETGTQTGAPAWRTLCAREGRDQDIVKASLYKPEHEAANKPPPGERRAADSPSLPTEGTNTDSILISDGQPPKL